MPRPRLGDLLLEKGLCTSGELRRALAQQQRWGGPLGEYVVALGLVPELELVQTLSEQLRLPHVDLDQPQAIDVEAAALLPREVCEQLHLMVFRQDGSGRFLDVAMAEPTNQTAIDAVRMRLRRNIRPYVAGPRAITRAIDRTYLGPDDDGFDMALLTPEPKSEHLSRSPPAPLELETPDIDALRLAITEASAVEDPLSVRALPRALPELGPDSREHDIAAERVRHLERVVRHLERTVRVLTGMLIEAGVLSYPSVTERMGRLQTDKPPPDAQGD